EINGLEFLEDTSLATDGSASIANGQHLVDLSSVFPGVTATLHLISPAVVVGPGAAVAPPGTPTTVGKTAQLEADFMVSAPTSVPAPVLGTTPLPVQVTFPMQLHGASATGGLTYIDCNPPATPPTPITATVHVTTDEVWLSGGPAKVSVDGGPSVPDGVPTSVGPVDFAGAVQDAKEAEGATGRVAAPAPTIPDLVSGVFNGAAITVTAMLPDGLPVSVPTSTVDDAITTATHDLNAYLGAAGSALGITVAGADVTVHDITCGELGNVSSGK
ncbi:MAG TPA: hypothetical protein VF954_07785, partial [Acidimicrobiales bacterium]